MAVGGKQSEELRILYMLNVSFSVIDWLGKELVPCGHAEFIFAGHLHEVIIRQ